MYKTSKLYWPFLILIDLIGFIFFFWKKFKKIPANPKNILVIKVDHIGDMIMASSFFRNLKKNYPKADIHVLCRSLTKDIAECIPSIDTIHVLDVPWFSRGKDSWKNLFSWMSAHKKKFDLVFELHTDPRNIYLASKVGKYTVGYRTRGFGFLLNKAVKWRKGTVHIIERNLGLLKGIGKSADDDYTELNIEEKYLESAEKKLGFSGKIIICHPITAREEKNREWEFWENINKNLLTKYKGAKIIYCGSKDDRDTLNQNIVFDNVSLFNFAGDFSMKEYLALLKNAELVVAADTFPVHARAAFGKKLLLITFNGYYGEHKKQWEPYFKNKALVKFIR